MTPMRVIFSSAPRQSGGALVGILAWLALALLLALSMAGCTSMALPTPDRSALGVLPTNTPTAPTPRLAVALGPRPSETATPTATTTPTPSATPTPSPSPTPSPTATPTTTPGPLVRGLGFRERHLERLDADGYTIAERQSLQQGGDRFLALILNPPEQSDTALGVKLPRLLIYHLPAGRPAELIFEDEGSDEVIQFAGYGQRWTQPLGWRDLTGDGLLELPIFAANGGFCFACTRVYVLQLEPVDAASRPEADTQWLIRELTGAIPFINLAQNPIIPKRLNDFDGDGVAAIEALDGSFEFAFGLFREYSPRFFRPLIWNGQRFADASRWSPGYFDGQIQNAAQAVQATYGQPLASQEIIGQALSVLLAYDASGRREEGWTVFWQLSDPVNWPSETTPGLLDWLSRIRQHLAGQFERGETFAPWPPLSPTLSAASNSGDAVQASNQITQPLPLPPPAPDDQPTPDPNATPAP
jgi:hypothetical protein